LITIPSDDNDPVQNWRSIVTSTESDEQIEEESQRRGDFYTKDCRRVRMLQFVIRETDFDAYVGGGPTHSKEQIYAELSKEAEKFFNAGLLVLEPPTERLPNFTFLVFLQQWYRGIDHPCTELVLVWFADSLPKNINQELGLKIRGIVWDSHAKDGVEGKNPITIVSSGEFGAEEFALAFAIGRRILHRGWCPKGRKTSEGVIPDDFQLQETPSSSYLQRAEWNVRDSDASLVITMSPALCERTKRVVAFASKHKKPFLHIFPDLVAPMPADIAAFIRGNKVSWLNIAATRSSKAPGIRRFTLTTLNKVFDLLDQ